MIKFLIILLLSSAAHAIERPVPSLNNGYIPPSDAANNRGLVPILFPGDTLVAGWTGRGAIASDDPAAGTIDCTGTANGLESGEFIIRSNLSEINAASPSSTTIWVCPGDYSDQSTVSPRAVGTSWTPGNFYSVRCLSSDRTKNPYNLNPNPEPSTTNAWATSHDVSEECIFPRMNTSSNNPQYWLFQGITWLDEAYVIGLQLVRLEGGADNFIFDRNWFDCKYAAPSTNGTNADCIKPQSGSDYITFQNNVIGPCAPIYDADMNGVGYHESADYGTVTRNEVFNCQKAFFSGGNFAGGSGRGTWVIDNDFYIDNRLYLTDAGYFRSNWEATGLLDHNDATSISQRVINPDGAQSSLFDPNGRYSCAPQTSISTKHGSFIASEKMLIKMNRVWGKRGSFSQCMGDGYGAGMSGSGQVRPANSRWESNVFFDMASGIRWPFNNVANSNVEGIEVYGNVFVLADYVAASREEDRWLLVFSPTCTGACIDPIPREFDFKYNSFGEVSIANGFRSNSVQINSYSGMTGQMGCNVAHGSDFGATAPSSVTGSGNVSVDGADWDSSTSLTNTKSMTAAQADEQVFCVWRKLQTVPEQYCTTITIVPNSTSDYVNAEAPAGCDPVADGITHDPSGKVRVASAAGAFEPIASQTPDPGVTLPPADGNNNRAPFIRVVHRSVDTVSTNWQTDAQQLPASCDVTLSFGASMTDLETAWNNPANNAICIAPGVDLGTGLATFTRTTCPSPIFILPSDYAVGAPSNYTTHPSNLLSSSRAQVGRVQFNTTAACEHVFYKVAFNPTGAALSSVSCAAGDASKKVILSHSDVQGGVNVLNCESADEIGIHYSVVTTDSKIPGSDRDCVRLPAAVSDTWVTHNEIRDCAGDAISGGNQGTVQNGGVRIWDNDIESTLAHKTDCDGTLVASDDSPCHAGGAAFDIRYGNLASNLDNRIDISRNRIRGWRATDCAVGASCAFPSTVFDLMDSSAGIVVRENEIWNSHNGFAISRVGTAVPGQDNHRYSFVGNLFQLKTFNITGAEPFCDGNGGNVKCGSFNNGWDIRGSNLLRFAFNTMRWDQSLGGVPSYFLDTGEDMQVVGNAFIDSGVGAATVGEFKCNAYENTFVLVGEIGGYSGPITMQDRSVNVDPITNPRTVTIPRLTRSETTASIGALCSSQTINETGYGNGGTPPGTHDGVTN